MDKNILFSPAPERDSGKSYLLDFLKKKVTLTREMFCSEFISADQIVFSRKDDNTSYLEVCVHEINAREKEYTMLSTYKIWFEYLQRTIEYWTSDDKIRSERDTALVSGLEPLKTMLTKTIGEYDKLGGMFEKMIVNINSTAPELQCYLAVGARYTPDKKKSREVELVFAVIPRLDIVRLEDVAKIRSIIKPGPGDLMRLGTILPQVRTDIANYKKILGH